MENNPTISELFKLYQEKKEEIRKRLEEFKEEKKDIDLLCELFFCILTPQSKAEFCWKCIENLKEKDLIFNGKEEEIKDQIRNVRFKNKKAKYIIEARKFFLNNLSSIKSRIKNCKDVFELRDFLVKNIKGFGYKESSHFLRNMGLGENIAILDRHILKNLKNLGVINEIPKTLTRKKYIEIEKKFVEFSKGLGIGAEELDLLLWCKETGKIFK